MREKEMERKRKHIIFNLFIHRTYFLMRANTHAHAHHLILLLLPSPTQSRPSALSASVASPCYHRPTTAILSLSGLEYLTHSHHQPYSCEFGFTIKLALKRLI